MEVTSRLRLLLELEARIRLFLPLHQDDDPERYRANGEMICRLCGHRYHEHPYFDEETCHGHPIDHRLCNGDVVHL
jgi:hypothetical protein